MRNALTQGFSSTLLIERQRYGDVLGRTVRDGIPFGDVVAMHFRLAATSTVADRTFELYRICSGQCISALHRSRIPRRPLVLL
jgi:hypothetical protein